MKKINEQTPEKDGLNASKNVSRRDFLGISLKALGGLAAIELGAAGILFLRSRSLSGEFGGVMTVGKIEEFTPGSVLEVEDGNFYLICTENNGFLAVYRRCPHLGCTVNWMDNEQKFLCPCHSATFGKNGEFNNKLVARALDYFPVLFEKGMVKVDTTMPIPREQHLPEHVSFPQSG
jgi:cytochrome b6-f complex iron-sulfur subunit